MTRNNSTIPFFGWIIGITAVLLLPLPRLYSDDRPGVKIDYELSGVTDKCKEQNEVFYVIKTDKEYDKVLKLINSDESTKLKELMPNFENQIGLLVFSRYKNRPEVQITFEEINRQGPIPAGKDLVFDEVHVYCDVEYIRGNRETDTKQSYWRFCLVSRDKLKDVNSTKVDPITEKTKFVLFKRIIIDTLQEPTPIK